MIQLKGIVENVDGLLVSKPADIFYLTGFWCEECLLACCDEPYIVTDSRYQTAAGAYGNTVISTDYIAAAAEVFKQKNIRRIAIQEDSLTARDFRFLCEHNFEPVFTRNTFQELRAIKRPDEIANIRAAQTITDEAFEKLLPFIAPGVRESEIAARLDYLMRECGADDVAFKTVVASGMNGVMPHAQPSEKTIKSGELVTMDFGARKNGYCSDMTRTVAVGGIDSRLSELYEAVLEAQLAGLKGLCAGISGAQADFAARSVLDARGLSKYFLHALGHGVGIEIHEQPRLSSRSTDTLVPGMVVTVEPGVYIEGIGGVRIEDMCVITGSGFDNLTGTDKKLIFL